MAIFIQKWHRGVYSEGETSEEVVGGVGFKGGRIYIFIGRTGWSFIGNGDEFMLSLVRCPNFSFGNVSKLKGIKIEVNYGSVDVLVQNLLDTNTIRLS